MSNARPKWLDRDIVSETEKKLGGKHWSEFSNDESIQMLKTAFIHNQAKEEYLQSIDDTPFSMKWNKFKDLLIRHGFELVLTDTFLDPHDSRPEELCLFGQREKGLLVVATSFRDDLNGGTCYGECTKSQEQAFNLPNGFSYGWTDIRSGWSIDVRDGMFSRIASLEELGFKHSPKWEIKNHFLWLVDYAQTKDDYDYKEINKERLSRCPDWIRNMIDCND